MLVDGADDEVAAAVRVLWEDLVDLPLPLCLLIHLQRQQQQLHTLGLASLTSILTSTTAVAGRSQSQRAASGPAGGGVELC